MAQTAFKAFYQKTSKPLWAYIYRISGDAEAASDIVQEAYLRFLQKPSESTNEQQMKAYLYAIATRLNLDRWKHKKIKEKWLPHFFHQQHGDGEHIEERIGLQTDIYKIFQDLNPQERALLWLAYVEEQPHRSIAEILGLQEKSVRVLLFRARNKLAAILKKRGIGTEVTL
jgi:RNA polymerase sigma-70 factor (ECF subfamily)